MKLTIMHAGLMSGRDDSREAWTVDRWFHQEIRNEFVGTSLCAGWRGRGSRESRCQPGEGLGGRTQHGPWFLSSSDWNDRNGFEMIGSKFRESKTTAELEYIN